MRFGDFLGAITGIRRFLHLLLGLPNFLKNEDLATQSFGILKQMSYLIGIGSLSVTYVEYQIESNLHELTNFCYTICTK